MNAAEYILAPRDGGLEKTLSAAEAKSLNFIDNPMQETRLSELLGQRGVDRFWMCEQGILIHGTPAQARTVSRIAEEFPNLIAAEQPRAETARAANGNHISGVFGNASRMFNVDHIRTAFTSAASDIGVKRAPRLRPSVRGNFGDYALAA